MSTCFDQWEKDPFFPAAEEVQESTDRMESVYRRWIHERRDNSIPASSGADPSNVSGDLRRELRTALGTAKWQLEELERVVRLNDEACSVGEDTRSRHNQFVEVIGSQISTVEKTLKTSNLEEGKPQLSWVQLDEGERDELALFLSAPFLLQGSLPPLPRIKGENRKIDGRKESTRIKGENHADPEKNNCHSNELDQSEAKEAKMQGHRRTASASADIEAWKISVFNETELPNCPPPKTPSFSCLTRAFESASKKKWPKNGFMKWKGGDQLQEAEMIPLHNNQISQGLNACYERSKSCLSSCDDYYDKQLYGWLGVLHRQLQRSQYQIQYGRPILMILCAVGIVFLIGALLSVILMDFCRKAIAVSA